MGSKWLTSAAFAVVLLTACGQPDPAELRNSGIAELEAGNILGAVVNLTAAVKQNHADLAARFHLGRAYLLSGRYNQAEQEFSIIARSDPDYSRLQLQLAEVLFRTGRYAAAIDLFERDLLRHPADATSLDLLGQAYLKLDDPAAAERAFRQAQALAPADPLPRFRLAQVELARQADGPASFRLRALLADHPSYLPATELLAEIHLGLDQTDQAIELYRRLAKLSPDRVEVLYTLGLLLLAGGHPGQADPVVARLQERFTDDHRTQLLSGIVLFFKRDHARALVFLQRAQHQSPTPLGAYYLGLCHVARKEFELALNQFQRLLDANPASIRARLLLATVLLRQQRSDESLARIRQVLSAEPDNCWGNNLYGGLLLQRRETESARAAFARALDHGSRLGAAPLPLALGRPDTGVDHLTEQELLQILAAAPELLAVRLTLAGYYLESGAYARVESILYGGLTNGVEDHQIYHLLMVVDRSQSRMAMAAAGD